LRGDPASGKFSVFHLRGDAVACVESVNAPGDHLVARRLIAQQAQLAPQELADASVSLKALADNWQAQAAAAA